MARIWCAALSCTLHCLANFQRFTGGAFNKSIFTVALLPLCDGLPADAHVLAAELALTFSSFSGLPANLDIQILGEFSQ